VKINERARAQYGVATIVIWLAMSGFATATVVSYSIEPALSSLTMTGDVAGTTLSPQGPGADVDTYHGTIVGDLVAGVLTFGGGSAIIADATISGPFLPAFGGTIDNYGMKTTALNPVFGLPAGPFAFRDVVFDITAGSLSDGTSPSLVDIPVTGTAASPFLGANALGGNGIWHGVGAASLTTSGGIETLTLPFQRESGQGGLHVFLTGTLIATRVVPEPTSFVLLASAVTLIGGHRLLRWRKRRSR
jgi:hypothetical protein